ncbi:hypothetical protein SCHPADRAFT_892316 [Schizopora paradoxa]|uniref:Uncharacterized protein n=1 Tax=Schizopora paradoxa TaxID=27342 RepID=A0A0H2RF50_9AGAM|nr:hypothetical protein SCHPADRAFT_892316 [Schizopora paradoxa]
MNKSRTNHASPQSTQHKAPQHLQNATSDECTRQSTHKTHVTSNHTNNPPCQIAKKSQRGRTQDPRPKMTTRTRTRKTTTATTPSYDKQEIQTDRKLYTHTAKPKKESKRPKQNAIKRMRQTSKPDTKTNEQTTTRLSDDAKAQTETSQTRCKDKNTANGNKGEDNPESTMTRGDEERHQVNTYGRRLKKTSRGQKPETNPNYHHKIKYNKPKTIHTSPKLQPKPLRTKAQTPHNITSDEQKATQPNETNAKTKCTNPQHRTILKDKHAGQKQRRNRKDKETNDTLMNRGYKRDATTKKNETNKTTESPDGPQKSSNNRSNPIPQPSKHKWRLRHKTSKDNNIRQVI